MKWLLLIPAIGVQFIGESYMWNILSMILCVAVLLQILQPKEEQS